MKIPDSRVIPIELKGCAIVIRLVQKNQEYSDLYAPNRDYQAVWKLAHTLLQEGGETYYKVQIVGLVDDVYTTPVYEALIADVYPFFVAWKAPDGTLKEQRYLRKAPAYKRYSDLCNQDYLELVTNSHPKRKRM